MLVFAELGAQFENMSHFDSPSDLQGLAGFRAGFAFLNLPKVAEGIDVQIAAHIYILNVHGLFVGAGHPIADQTNRLVAEHAVELGSVGDRALDRS